MALHPSGPASTAEESVSASQVFGAVALGAAAFAAAVFGANWHQPRSVASDRGAGVALGTVAADPDAPLSLLVGGMAKLDLPLGQPVPPGAVARAFFVRGSDARPWEVGVTVRPDGMIELRGPTTDPFGGAVAAALVVVVSPGPTPAPSPEQCAAPCLTVRRMVSFVRPIVPMVPAK